MSRGWRFSAQASFETELLEALSLLVIRTDLAKAYPDTLLLSGEMDKSRTRVRDLLHNFAKAVGSEDSATRVASSVMSPREYTVYRALRRTSLAGWAGIRESLPRVLRWLNGNAETPSKEDIDFLRKLSRIVSVDLELWSNRLRSLR